MQAYENLNILWASIIVEELIRNEIDYFCISPGSRSSPLVVSVARNKKARSIICYDERGSAFHALGYARATNKPAVVITTSGTAVANCFPAVVEASMDNIPLIILSADRPVELQDSMANQTIPQDHIFGRYVRYFFNLPSPGEDIPLQMIATTVDQAIFRALTNPQGPVHINCMFREPLHPEKKRFSSEYISDSTGWFSFKRPYTEYYLSCLYLPEKKIKEIASILNSAKNGLLVVGGLKSYEKEGVIQLIKKIKWPVFLDIRSNISASVSSNIIQHFSLLLSSQILNFSWDVVLHIGTTPVSKHLMDFIKQIKPEQYIVVKNHPYRQDFNHISTVQIQADINVFCKEIIPLLNSKTSNSLDQLVKISKNASQLLKKLFYSCDEINEASLAYWISSQLPDNSALFLSNSMPIRDMDMYGHIKKNVIIGANRGASGIDGIIATATGFAAGLNRPVTLIIGDLAFIHDLNSLFILKKIEVPVIIILINNNGGGIFSFLDISRYSDVFEKYFVAPHNITSFRDISSLFGLPYFAPENRKDFLNTYRNCIDKYASAIIEISIDRAKNHHFHELVRKTLKNVIGKDYDNF